MAFGQQSGPPATSRQVQELLALVRDLGHSDFRDARGPLGFTQRQAGGKFTRDEVKEFIERLQQAEHDGVEPARPETTAARARPATARTPAAPPKMTNASPLLAKIESVDLAAELQRRGWVVLEP
jgi:hypothetical protein